MNKILNHFVLICLTSLIIISPEISHSADKNIIASNTTLTSSANKHKAPDANQTTLTETNIHDRKATLNNDSRGLSGFFILGIIINIIMIITFSWWFSKEWRRSKK